ncbi:HI1506-related protein [Pseudoalteromonas sp. S16_S37]|uniref:HI1506-related protein n=1 Tax=Pseudoalteromonas sp. S16_S37 TaxID=2720228 RepID=UPI00168068F7|nr:HI1506-related protein [Pseudoalteromonas sp. S16_S37]MBD1584766.1 hypothetical protein [Pseudoalteromonas sp. S16_S37]
MANKTTHTVCIFSQQPNGYRRAGLTLNYGQNDNLQVTEQQLEALQKDTRIKVQVLKASETASTPQNMEPRGVGSDLVLDLSNAPEELAHIIAAIHELKPNKKPNVDELAFEVDGVEGEQKPTAAQRDEAWAWYQSNVVNTEQ